MKTIAYIVAAFLSVSLFAQPVLKVNKESHDFGTIEEGTQASYTFDIVNTGTEPLIISNVQPSCGCTTPEWTKTPIAPGAKGTIMATFNSQGRPGAFNKAITISSNTVEATRVFTIKGFVVAKTEKTYSEEEIKNSPLISIERVSFNFGKVEVSQNIHQKVKVTNKGKSPLKFEGIQSGCYCVNLPIPETPLAPGQTVQLEFTYSPKTLGEQTDIFTIKTNDIATANPSITLQANVVQSLNSGSIMNQGTSTVPFK